MKKAIVFVVMILCVVLTYGAKLATLDEVMKPVVMNIADGHLYITEGARIYIYSLDDYTLKGQFGKRGMGPKEFMVQPNGQGLQVFFAKDSLLVSSLGKLSIFSRDGIYKKEMKLPGGMGTPPMFQANGENQYVGFGVAREDTDVFLTYNHYDSKLAKGKEFQRLPFMKKMKMEFPITPPLFYTIDGKIVVGGHRHFALDVYDSKGEKLTTITRDYKNLKAHSSYKKEVLDYFKTNPATSASFAQIKQMLAFPDVLPAIKFFWVDSGKVYIQTFLEENDNYEFFVYGLDGSFISRQFLPAKDLSPIQPSAQRVYKGQFYQLEENEDEETWELHAYSLN
ncbi:MAG: hypothetical protein GY765_01645 [bacterium]|nr:hypothetical protein [bacterium]